MSGIREGSINIAMVLFGLNHELKEINIRVFIIKNFFFLFKLLHLDTLLMAKAIYF